MTIAEALEAFGLTENEKVVYTSLATSGWITALELSRKSNIKRTTLYRILESLVKRGLVEISIDDKTTHYAVSDVRSFDRILMERENSLKSAMKASEEIKKFLTLNKEPRSETRVRFFRGKRGLKTLEWRLLENKNQEILMFSSSQWIPVLGHEFTESWRRQAVEQKSLIRELANKQDSSPIPDTMDVAWTSNKQYIKNHFRHRIISEDIVTVTEDLMVCNETVQFRGYRDGNFMGVEITNHDYASMLRDLFEMAWKQAEVVDAFGDF